MKIEKNRLSYILDRCMESLALTTEMSTDLTIPPDDYSYEYVFNDMLYEIASLDRIINYYDHNDSFKKELRSINSIYKRCFDYSNDDFFKKLDKYQIQYYSTENMVQEMEEIEYRLPFIDDHEIEISITDTLFGLLEKRDSSYLLSRNEGITQKIASQYINFSTFDNYFRESEKFISSKSSIFKALSNFIVGFRTNNLIPNIQEYSWWYSFHSITLDNFILSLESNTIQNKSLAAYLNRQLNELDMIGRFETAVLKTLPYIRKMSKQLNDSIDEILIPASLYVLGIMFCNISR